MKKYNLTAVLILFIIIVIVSCKKEAQLPPRSEEVTVRNLGNGIMERTHKGGPNGATITYSNWIPRTTPDWYGYGTSTVSTDFNTTTLTQSIVDNGTVLVYYKWENIIRPLPNIDDFHIWKYQFIVGKITASITLTDGFPISEMAPMEFRYILVEGTQLDGGRISLDLNDYDAVRKYFGLPED